MFDGFVILVTTAAMVNLCNILKINKQTALNIVIVINLNMKKFKMYINLANVN